MKRPRALQKLLLSFLGITGGGGGDNSWTYPPMRCENSKRYKPVISGLTASVPLIK
jgi:hypothetical protein